jgi:hypothetical protein
VCGGKGDLSEFSIVDLNSPLIEPGLQSIKVL